MTRPFAALFERKGRLICVLLVSALAPATGGADEAKVNVYAAASLTEAMQALEEVWEEAGRSDAVAVLAASSALARQIVEGADADLFISANDDWVDWLSERVDFAAPPRVVAGNRLVVIAPAGAAPAGDPFAPDAAQRIAIAEPGTVPAGIYARLSLEATGEWAAVSERLVVGANVRDVLLWVVRGEADRGLVYATDAARTDTVEIIATRDPATHPTIRYVALPLTPDGARFTDFLMSDAGQAELRALGFAPPPE
ncbi:MAG: molybdate ABC transporter substrate-binding protein [Pseudomonadota bacterium]